MQAAMELERNPSVCCLHHFFAAFINNLQSQNSGLGHFANAQNILINGGTFVSRSHRLHNFIIMTHYN